MTFKHILAELADWCAGLPRPHLVEDLQVMRELLRGTARDLQTRLDTQVLEGEFGELMQGTLEAYAELDDSLSQLIQLVQAQDREAVKEEHAFLRAGVASLRQYTEALEHWLAEPSMRCPRCGSAEDGSFDEICPRCDLERLIPDPRPNPAASRKFQSLSSSYVELFQTYLAVVAGERPLADLEVPLTVLERQFQGHLKAVPLTADPDFRSVTQALSAGCRESLEGLAQMRRSFESRQIADLNAGWLRVFSAAEALKDNLGQLQNRLGLASQTSSSGDFIQLSEDD